MHFRLQLVIEDADGVIVETDQLRPVDIQDSHLV